ncbi:MAG: hypothetical protein K8R23_17245 [Chthoniobacter sp.]|nr:hypothetical protein [Chthoniobacter sp.]
MKPLKVKAIKKHYNPRYPQFVEVTDWRHLVHTSNRSLFHPSTLLFAGLLGSSIFVTNDTQAQEQKLPARPPLRSGNENAAEIANKALAEVAKTGFWFEHSQTGNEKIVEGNPAVKIPQIRISFGNSYVGVFDTIRAKEVTLKLFEAYGVKLESNFMFKKEGVSFEADGYDPKKKVGFEILGADRPPQGFSRQKPKVESDPAKLLDDAETKSLKEAVAKGQESLFLVPAEKYPNMDNDQYTPLRAYLQSVLDYLDWLKLQGRL